MSQQRHFDPTRASLFLRTCILWRQKRELCHAGRRRSAGLLVGFQTDACPGWTGGWPLSPQDEYTTSVSPITRTSLHPRSAHSKNVRRKRVRQGKQWVIETVEAEGRTRISESRRCILEESLANTRLPHRVQQVRTAAQRPASSSGQAAKLSTSGSVRAAGSWCPLG